MSREELDRLERTVLVKDVPEKMKETLIVYLENARQGGGMIESDSYRDGTLTVCFENKRVAVNMLQKGSILVQEVVYPIIKPASQKKQPNPETPIQEHVKVCSNINKEFNILLLGETGVGKSTWINGFANYLAYPTLEEAKQNSMISLVPMSFTIADSEYNETKISTGEKDRNESHVKAGQSSTQHPKTYRFTNDKLTVRLIDTPGIGDTRGIEKDKENFANILSHIATFDALHGIFILLKPNQARITVQFEYCIKELLTNLHKDACRNIVVCFTNSRSTFYQPGDTLPAIRKLFEDGNIDICLDKKTIYCIDNEAVRYLAAIHYPAKRINFKKSQEQDFIESWDESVAEMERLMYYISELEPHLVKNTLSINDARHMIFGLTKPLADVTDTIQRNVAAMETKKKMLSESTASKELLATQLVIPIIEQTIVQLNPHQRVCLSVKCRKDFKEGCVTKTHYLCSQDYAKQFTDNFKIGKMKLCSKCDCDARDHKIITYTTVHTEKEVTDANINRKVTSLETSIKAIRDYLTNMEKLISEYRQEQNLIREASVKFVGFLKANAITPFNDAMDDYLKMFIKQREKDGTENQTLDGLKKVREQYLKEKHGLEESMKNSMVDAPTPDEINTLIKNLYSMKHVGKKIQEVVKVAEAAEAKAALQNEVHVPSVQPHASKYPNILQKLVQ